jgi:hypothetical protein
MGDFIYESPDNGKTIYSRKYGSSSRHLVIGRDLVKESLRKIKRKDRLMKICELAETNPTINDQLLKLEELYILINDDKND